MLCSVFFFGWVDIILLPETWRFSKPLLYNCFLSCRVGNLCFSFWEKKIGSFVGCVCLTRCDTTTCIGARVFCRRLNSCDSFRFKHVIQCYWVTAAGETNARISYSCRCRRRLFDKICGNLFRSQAFFIERTKLVQEQSKVLYSFWNGTGH